MKTQRFDTSGNTVVSYVFLTCCIMNVSDKNITKIVIKQSLFLSWKALKQNGREFFFYWRWNTAFIGSFCIDYEAEREYCGPNSESVRNKYEQVQQKLIQKYPKNSTDGFLNSENPSRRWQWNVLVENLKSLEQVSRKLLIPIKREK